MKLRILFLLQFLSAQLDGPRYNDCPDISSQPKFDSALLKRIGQVWKIKSRTGSRYMVLTISRIRAVRDDEPEKVTCYLAMIVSRHWLSCIAKISSNFPTVYPYRWTVVVNVTRGTDIQDHPMSKKNQDRFLNDAQVCLHTKSLFLSDIRKIVGLLF